MFLQTTKCQHTFMYNILYTHKYVKFQKGKKVSIYQIHIFHYINTHMLRTRIRSFIHDRDTNKLLFLNAIVTRKAFNLQSVIQILC